MKFAAIILVAGLAFAYSASISNNLDDDDIEIENFQYVGISNTTASIIDNHGYGYEEHEVTSDDGYILTMYRIPGSPNSPVREGKPVVFLQHGLLCSSADWVVIGPGKALAYILADVGYDVWLGNHRGNTHSRKHIYLNPNKKAFWDYSWHEVGVYDLPAMIDYALKYTGQQKLHYVGHSQGTTAFFVMASMRPEYNKKIKSMQALAPVVFMSNLFSPFIRVIAPFVDVTEWIMNMLGVHEFMPSNEMLILGGYYTCRDESPFQIVCANSFFLMGGYNSAQLNRTMLPDIIANTPAGAAVGQIVHYGQEVNSGKFRQYDHGFFGNLKRYGSGSPPNYPLNKVTAPVALHFSNNDWLAADRDVQKLAGKLPNLIGRFRISDLKWNHLDFTYGIDAKSMLYDRVINLMRRYD